MGQTEEHAKLGGLDLGKLIFYNNSLNMFIYHDALFYPCQKFSYQLSSLFSLQLCVQENILIICFWYVKNFIYLAILKFLFVYFNLVGCYIDMTRISVSEVKIRSCLFAIQINDLCLILEGICLHFLKKYSSLTVNRTCIIFVTKMVKFSKETHI